MAYTKQTFTSGQTLKASDLNTMSQGIKDLDDGKQEKLVSGTNLKTVNGQSLLGSGDIAVEGTSLKLKGKKVMFFGDSITEGAHYYRNDLIALTGMESVGVFARSGATMRSSVAVSDLNGTPEVSNNSMPNHVKKWLNSVSDYKTPDIVLVAAGTNDGMNATASSDLDESQFTTESEGYVDVDSCNLGSYSGAMRWIYEKIKGVYPNALVVFCTPMQLYSSSFGGRVSYQSSKIKRDSIVNVCERLSAPYIDAFRDSGVYGKFESDGSHKYLGDGIHPNADGAVNLAKCYARKLEFLVSMEEAGPGSDTGGGNTGSDTGGGETGNSIVVNGIIDLTGSFGIGALSGTYNIKKFTPNTNGKTGTIRWKTILLETSLYDAADNVTVNGSEIATGEIQAGESIENFTIDATHVIKFATDGEVKMQYGPNSGAPFGLIDCPGGFGGNIAKKGSFYVGYSFGGTFELAD